MSSTFVERYGSVQFWGKKQAPYPRVESCDVLGCDVDKFIVSVLKNEDPFWIWQQKYDPWFLKYSIETLKISDEELCEDIIRRSRRQARNDERKRRPAYVFDHCHIHGWVRGNICQRCNYLMRDIDRGIPRETGIITTYENGGVEYIECPRFASYNLYWENCPDCKTSGKWEAIQSQGLDDITIGRLPELALIRQNNP